MTCTRNPDGVLAADCGPAEVDDAHPLSVIAPARAVDNEHDCPLAETAPVLVEVPQQTLCRAGRCYGGGVIVTVWEPNGATGYTREACPCTSPARVDSPLGLPVEGTATSSALEAAWTEADRLAAVCVDDREAQDAAAQQLNVSFKAYFEADMAARALGPRPKVPS